ncbi:MAG: ABC transporter permease subunit [Candidatus Odinarchaeota archaeon]|nr:ABC transporter permease subunit [Candidatus Odinarchaeota archaeon]
MSDFLLHTSIFRWVTLIFIFAILLRWFPAGNTISTSHPTSTLGYVVDYIWHITLPVFLIMLTTIGFYVYFTREYLLGTFSDNCIHAAHPRKQGEDNFSLSHGLKNTISTLIKVTLSNYANLVVGLTVITEIVFNWYGLGEMLFSGVKWNDVFLVEFSFLMIMIFSVISNFAITLVYWFLNMHSEAEK